MLRRIKNKLLFEWRKLYAPQMSGRYRTADGTVLPRTRVSNTTFIDHKEGLKLGDNVFIGHFNFLDASNGLTISEGCQVTNYISIITHSSHISIRLYGKNYGKVPDMKGYVKGAVSIGAYSFIGPHSVIMPGTTIGKGSIVSAYSYVQGEFPDFSIIAGNPAKVIGDTRAIDKTYLENDEELKKNYGEWADR